MPQMSLFSPSSQPWTPREYQLRGVQFLLQHQYGALFLDPGLGKTSITLAAISLLKRKGVFQKALIVSPLRVSYSVWPDELERWTDFHGLTYCVLHGRDKDAALKEDVDLHIINPEGLAWLIDPEVETGKSGQKKIKVDIKRFTKLGYDVLIVDELTRFKHITSQRFKMLKPLLPTFQRRWGLTGSPAANGFLDLFGQVYVLDNGKTFGRYYSRYRTQYFAPLDFYQRQWTLRAGSRDLIYQKLAPLALRMSAEEYGSLPPLVEQTITVELPEKVRQIYDRLEERFFVMLDKKPLTAANAAVASTKLHQIASGGVFLDYETAEVGVKPQRQNKEFVHLHYEKLDVVEDLMAELQGASLLVAYNFKHDLARFQERFGANVPYVGGGANPTHSARLLEAWNRGEVPLLLGHPQSLGHGVNIQGGGAHVCWHSLTWNEELRDQFNRRVYRSGQQAHTVFVYYVVAKNTIDEVIMATLKAKRSTQQQLFDALTSYRERRGL